MNQIASSSIPPSRAIATPQSPGQNGMFAAAFDTASNPSKALAGPADNQIAAFPLAAPAIGAGTVTAVAMAVVASIGVSWNSLSADERRIVRDTVWNVLTDMVQRGVIGMRHLGDTIRNLTQLPGEVGSALRRAVMDALQLNARVPDLNDVINAVHSLPVVNQCQPRRPEDLIGMCGECTADAYGQLRAAGIKRISQEAVANGAHYVLEIQTNQGVYVLDCTIGQFGGSRDPNNELLRHNLLNGSNVVLMKKETFLRLLDSLGARLHL
jgi:predicted transglutaminase-like cysteine proteinase